MLIRISNGIVEVSLNFRVESRLEVLMQNDQFSEIQNVIWNLKIDFYTF